MEIKRDQYPDIYAAGPTYTRGVRAGNTLYISGTTSRGVEATTPMAQLRVVLDRIVRIVEAEGGTASNIVKMTTFLTDKSDWWPIEGEQKEIWEEFFQGKFPANAYLEVSGLAADDLFVEIEAIAVLDD